MAEYIRREDVVEWFMPYAHAEESIDADVVIADIKGMKAADVAPVIHGWWIVRFDGPYKRRRCYCSHCGKHNGIGGIAKNQEKPYCPNCGVKMDGGAGNGC